MPRYETISKRLEVLLDDLGLRILIEVMDL